MWEAFTSVDIHHLIAARKKCANQCYVAFGGVNIEDISEFPQKIMQSGNQLTIFLINISANIQPFLIVQ